MTLLCALWAANACFVEKNIWLLGDLDSKQYPLITRVKSADAGLKATRKAFPGQTDRGKLTNSSIVRFMGPARPVDIRSDLEN